MLKRIPIDIVEMVIVTSDSYKLFEELQIFLPKLSESKRKSRITYKLIRELTCKLNILCATLGLKYKDINQDYYHKHMIIERGLKYF